MLWLWLVVEKTPDSPVDLHHQCHRLPTTNSNNNTMIINTWGLAFQKRQERCVAFGSHVLWDVFNLQMRLYVLKTTLGGYCVVQALSGFWLAASCMRI